jgi:hypothetical protein
MLAFAAIVLLLLLGGADPWQRPLYGFGVLTHGGAATLCVLAAALRKIRHHVRCRQCGHLWRK